MHLMVQGVLESHPIRLVIHVRFSFILPSVFLFQPDFHRPLPLLLSHASRAAPELDNLITMQHNMRTSANKVSNDAYDVNNSTAKCFLKLAECGHPIFRATTPLSRCILKSKGHCQCISLQIIQQLKLFCTIISANQLSLYGAVANMCEEFEAHQDRSSEPDVLMGQSIVLGEIKAEVSLQNENPLNHQILWQQHIERIESLSPESKVSRFCKEAGLMRIVEVGQYFMTKDTGDLRQFRSVACREYTLHRDDPSSQPKGWIQGNTRIGLVFEVTTSYMYGKHGIESRICKTILILGQEFLVDQINS